MYLVLILKKKNTSFYNFSNWEDNSLGHSSNYSNQFDSDITNACNYFQLPKYLNLRANDFFFNLTNIKNKSSYSLYFFKVYAILKACSEEHVFLEVQNLCYFFFINISKFLKFQKYIVKKKMGYLQPSNMEQECLKLLNILNVKNHIDIKKLFH